MTGRLPRRRGGPRCGCAASLALGLALVAGHHASAAAQEFEGVIGRQVVGVRLILEGRVLDDPSLLTVLETRAGRPLALAEVRESMAHLMALERFADVQVTAEPGQQGIVLRYDLVALRRITEIRVSGNTGIPAGELERLVRERFGQSPALGVAEGVEAFVVAACAERGFGRATARAEVVPEPQSGGAALLVGVQAGERVRVGVLTVSVERGLDTAELRQRLGLTRGAGFDRVEVERSAAVWADALRERGYFEASAVVETTPAANPAEIDVTLTARRGPLVALEFRGDPVPERRRADLVPIQREGSVDQDLLENSQLAIEEYLKAQGYRDASVEVSRELDGDTLRIVVEVARGPQFRIGRVDVVVAPSVPVAGLPPASALEPGELFVRARLNAELARIAEQFRRNGYRDVTVRPDLTDALGAGRDDARTAIRIVVEPGARIMIDRVVVTGNHEIATGTLVKAVRSAAAGPLYERQVDDDREAVLTLCAELGFQLARVDARTTPSGPGTVLLEFDVTEGPRIVVDHVLVVGNLRISTATIRRQLAIAEGDPLSPGALAESRRRLASLGLFRRVRILDRQSGAPARRDVVVAVEEAPATTVSYGVGVEGGTRVQHVGPQGDQATEGIEIVPRGFFEIGRRNLWGKNRSVNLFTRASVRRRDQPVGSPDGGGGFDFREYRVISSFREPAVIGPRTEFVATGFLEQGIRSSYSFNRRGVATELAYRLQRNLSVSGRYSLDKSRVFDQRLTEDELRTIDRVFPQVRLSSLSSSLTRDTRDDAIDPSSGVLIIVDGELAAQRLGSEVGFLRTYVQGFAFRRAPGTRRVVLAGAARLGLSAGFARDVVIEGDDGLPIVTTVKDVPVSRRFFAGGDSTHRAFGNDRLGAPDTLDPDGDPKGGRALLLFNGELRVTLTSWLSAVGFVDVGNVFASADQVDLADLRAGLGTGLRVKTPLGPFRVDVGFKLNRRDFANGARERGYAIQFGIGQAF